MCFNSQSSLFKNVSFRKSLSCKCTFFRTFIYINSYLEVTKFSAALLASAQCQYFVSMHCDCLSCDCTPARCVVSLFLIALLSPFVFVMSVAVSHSSTPPLKAVILSPSLTVCLMFGLVCCALLVIISRHCFSVLSQYSHAILVLCEGYLTAISGFIFALSFWVISALLCLCYRMP